MEPRWLVRHRPTSATISGWFGGMATAPASTVSTATSSGVSTASRTGEVWPFTYSRMFSGPP
jgi:hypothetical protein